MISEPFIFTTSDGTPIPDWANIFLNERIKTKRTCELYNELIHNVEDYFTEWNKIHCSECKARSWEKQRKEFLYSHGCCRDCAGNKGYIQSFFYSENGSRPVERELLTSRKELFNDVHGFFDESTFGCSLPRHLRSRTCLRYCCDYRLYEVIEPTVEAIVKLRGYP